MGLETGTYLDALNASWPVGAVDTIAYGDDHLRLIKTTLRNSFPGQVFPIASKDAAGGSGAYTVTLSPAPAAYVKYMRVTALWNASHTTDTVPTLNVNGLGAKSIVADGNYAITKYDLVAGIVYDFVYNGSAFICLNPRGRMSGPPRAVLQNTGGVSDSADAVVSARLLNAQHNWRLRLSPLIANAAATALNMRVFANNSRLGFTPDDLHSFAIRYWDAAGNDGIQAISGYREFQITPTVAGWNISHGSTEYGVFCTIEFSTTSWSSDNYFQAIAKGQYANSTREVFFETRMMLKAPFTGFSPYDGASVDGIELFYSTSITSLLAPTNVTLFLDGRD